MTHGFAHQPSRRQMIRSLVGGSVLMPGILSGMFSDAALGQGNPLAHRPSHFGPRAKRVIFLYMSGGVSHVDSFDPKPRLTADHGKQVTLDHPETNDRPGYEKLFLKRPQWDFKPRGRCGTEISEMFPFVAAHADELAVIRSMHCDHSNHYNATL